MASTDVVDKEVGCDQDIALEPQLKRRKVLQTSGFEQNTVFLAYVSLGDFHEVAWTESCFFKDVLSYKLQ